MTQEELFKVLVAHCKEYGYIFPSSEIYDGLAAVYDYGQLGVELKNNIKQYWWNAMTRLNENIVGIDACIFMHPKTWVASGHVAAFNDPLIDNKDSKKRYRADVLIEDYLAKIEEKINKEVEKGRRKFGESFDEAKFRETNPNVLREKAHYEEVHNRYVAAEQANDLAEYKQIILDCGIVCPISGTKNWTDVRQFNLMFSTQFGSVGDDSNTIYLRPETAQGIFVNFQNVQRTMRKKIPFGIAQIGKSFRNEITPGNFIFRTREFEQMELEFFCEPGTELEWYDYWRSYCYNFLRSLGMSEERLRRREHSPEELCHYSNGTTDIEYRFPFGWGELWGVASRTDYDLKAHAEHSGKSMEYMDPFTNARYIPYCIEPSVGAGRMALAFLCDCYDEETLENGDVRNVLHLHPALAPYKAAVLPLQKKLGDKAKELYAMLSKHFMVDYDETGAIGKRYRRQDEIGTPLCITVDFETVEGDPANDMQKDTVTVRDRDTMQQIRLPIDQLVPYIEKKIEF